MPNAGDWCTVRYAAAALHRDESTVRRMVAAGTLTRHPFRAAEHETAPTMLWWPEVEELRRALQRTGRLHGHHDAAE